MLKFVSPCCSAVGILFGLAAAAAVAQNASYDLRIQADFDAFIPSPLGNAAVYDPLEGLVLPRTQSGGSDAYVPYAADDFTAMTRLRFLDNPPTTDYASLFFRDAAVDDGSASGYAVSLSDAGELNVVRLDGISNQTILGSVASSGLDPVANDILLEVRVVGAMIELTAWNAGLPQPAPQIVVTDNAANPYLDGSFVDLVNSSFDGPPGSTIAFRSLELIAVPEPTAGMIAVLCAAATLAARRRVPQSRDSATTS